MIGCGTLTQDTGRGDILLYRDRITEFKSRWLHQETSASEPQPVDLSSWNLTLTLHDEMDRDRTIIPVGLAPDASGTALVRVDPSAPATGAFLNAYPRGMWHLNAERDGHVERISDGYFTVTP